LQSREHADEAGIEFAERLVMKVHAIRRVCVLCSSPILGIPQPASPDVCFICGLSEEEERNIQAKDAVTPRSERLTRRRNRPTLRSV